MFTKPRRLEDGEEIKDFCCGIDVVDIWARKWAPKAKKRGTAVVYVSFDAESGDIAGFYSLSSHSLAREMLSGGWLKRNAPVQVPVILMGMLGVAQPYQGHKLGSQLLYDAMSRSLFAAETIGAKALVVDPADEKVRAFYGRFGFKEIAGTKRLFVPLSENTLK